MPEGYLSVLEIVSLGPTLLCAKFIMSLSSHQGHLLNSLSPGPDENEYWKHLEAFNFT